MVSQKRMIGLILLPLLTSFGLPAGSSAQTQAPSGFASVRPRLGTFAPDFTLERLEGGSFQLYEALSRGPVLVRFATPT